MIVVRIENDGTELARIEIIPVAKNDDDTADYKVQFRVKRGGALGLHKRWIESFPRKRYNTLALLRQALNTLEPKELELERGFDPDRDQEAGAPNLARKVRGARAALQRRED